MIKQNSRKKTIKICYYLLSFVILCNPLSSSHTDDSTELDWDTMVSFSDPSAPKGTADHDCKIGGRYFVNGSIWHPVIGPFGEMDCVLCKCLNRRIDCSRLKCPSRDKLQCTKPVKVAGQCCPVCPLTLMSEYWACVHV